MERATENSCALQNAWNMVLIIASMGSLQLLVTSSSPSPCAVMASTVGRRSILFPTALLLKLNDASTELKDVGINYIEKDHDNDENVKIIIKDEFSVELAMRLREYAVHADYAHIREYAHAMRLKIHSHMNLITTYKGKT